jgi:hypothetical protein
VSTDDFRHPAHFVECSHNKVDTDIIISPCPDFMDKFTFRGVVKHNRWRLDILRDVIKPPASDDLTITENTLASRHLGMK